MEGYTKEQRVFIVEKYFKNNEGFSNKIIFNDKIHFYLDRLVNGIVAFEVQKIHK